MCAYIDTHRQKHFLFLPFFCTSSVAFIAKKASLLYKYHKISFCTTVHKTISVYITSSLYKCTQNQYTEQVYTKLAHCTSLHKTSLLYKCTQNQFTIQVYIKPVYCTSETGQQRNVHGQTILRNVQGRNITNWFCVHY